MIYRLRRRFIAIAVFSLLFVLLSITAFINIWNCQSIIEGADNTLALIVDNNGYFPRPPKGHLENQKELRKGGMRFPDGEKFNQSPEAPFTTRYFSVLLDAQGNPLSVNTGSIAAITTKEASDMALQVLSEGRSAGFLTIYRFAAVPRGDRTQVVFLDCTRELGTARNFLINSLCVDGVGLAAVSILIWIFSSAAVRPVAESYEKQKRFITDAGHELKTPLAIISANVDVLELDTGETQWTQSIRNQITRMAKLTAHLTLLASMEETEQKLLMESVNLSTLVEDVFHAMNPLAKSHEKELFLQLTPEITTQGNFELLQQLLTILLDNAIKYSVPSGKIDVILSKHAKGAILTVCNDVEGFSPGKQDQLFERFYRADSSRSRESGGHGLGLSIAKAIAAAHKLKINADCPDGKKFIITIKYF